MESRVDSKNDLKSLVRTPYKNINKKILLVSLRDPFMDSDRVMPPLGVMSLQSYLMSLGIDSTIENNFDLANIENYSEYTYIAISCMTPQKIEAYNILRAIKSIDKSKKVIIGGPHAKYYLEDCLKEPFDYVVVGDGEYALKSIVENQADGRVINIPINEEEMNKLPIPYRDPKFLSQYSFTIQGINTSTVLTAKGCPMRCAFCEDAGTRVRLYYPENIDRQINDIVKAGFNGIMFYDDIFALSKKRVNELSKVIGKYNISYRAFGHAKSMDNDMASMLSNSGCIEMGFGAESGSQKILDIINKKTKIEENIRFVEICNKHNIKVKAFIIVGLPGEDLSSINETKKFLDFLTSNKFINKFGKEITNDFDITIYFPYKGTAIRDSIDKNNKDFDIYFTRNPDEMLGFYKGINGAAENVVRTSKLSSEEINKIQKELLNEYKKRVIKV